MPASCRIGAGPARPIGRTLGAGPDQGGVQCKDGRARPLLTSRRGDPHMTDTHAGPTTPGAGVVDSSVFAKRYLAHAGTQLANRSPELLAGIARAALDFGRARPWGQTLVRLSDGTSGDGEAVTVVDIVSADAPYIVESIWAELERSGHPVQRSLHPQLVVTRDPGGQMSHVFDIDDNADVPDGAIVESWMHLELDPVPAAERDALAENVGRVMDDVLHARADAPHMYKLIRELADQLKADPGHFDR